MTPAPLSTNVPGGAKSWLDLLPEPWCYDPKVVVYMVPQETKFIERKAVDSEFKGTKCVFANFKRAEGTEAEETFDIPLQLVDKDYGNFIMQKKVVEAMKGRMHPVKWVGQLSEMPAGCGVHETFMPIALNFDKPHLPMLHIRELFANVTKRSNVNG